MNFYPAKMAKEQKGNSRDVWLVKRQKLFFNTYQSNRIFTFSSEFFCVISILQVKLRLNSFYLLFFLLYQWVKKYTWTRHSDFPPGIWITYWATVSQLMDQENFANARDSFYTHTPTDFHEIFNEKSSTIWELFESSTWASGWLENMEFSTEKPTESSQWYNTEASKCWPLHLKYYKDIFLKIVIFISLYFIFYCSILIILNQNEILSLSLDFRQPF